MPKHLLSKYASLAAHLLWAKLSKELNIRNVVRSNELEGIVGYEKKNLLPVFTICLSRLIVVGAKEGRISTVTGRTRWRVGGKDEICYVHA